MPVAGALETGARAILARLVAPPRGRAGMRAGLQTENLRLERSSQVINEVREELADAGVSARAVAMTSSSLSSDLVHIVEREPVDLVLIEGRRRLVGEGRAAGRGRGAAQSAARRGGARSPRQREAIEIGPDKPVLVPFGGAEHDWSALELGTWLASATGAPLKMLGVAGRTDDGTSVTRMLADAGLLAQQATGIRTDPLVVEGGRDGIIAAASGAGLLVIGLSDRWRREGLGPTRSEIARAAPAPVLFVRRGTRPGLFASRDNVTQFKWSMADMSSALSGLQRGTDAAERGAAPQRVRVRAQGDHRIHARRSIPTGGHCSPTGGHRQVTSGEERPLPHPGETEALAGRPGSNPQPSSSTDSSIRSPTSRTDTHAVLAEACLTTLLSASWTIR